jgi:hypothetical protein
MPKYKSAANVAQAFTKKNPRQMIIKRDSSVTIVLAEFRTVLKAAGDPLETTYITSSRDFVLACPMSRPRMTSAMALDALASTPATKNDDCLVSRIEAIALRIKINTIPTTNQGKVSALIAGNVKPENSINLFGSLPEVKNTAVDVAM